MTHIELEKLAEDIYPDVDIPVDTGDTPIQLPDIIVSKQELREAFIAGFQIGYGRGIDKGEDLRYKKRHKKSWKW